MYEYAKQYERTHCGQVLEVQDYRFKFEEWSPKKPFEVVRVYWVMLSYFYEPKKD